MEDTDAYLWNRRHDVLYRVQLSVLYHQKRERFFEACDKVGKAVSVIGGSAALARLGTADSLTWIAAGITITSTLSLVFGFADRSKRHAELARNFRQLEADIAAKGERDFAEADICAWDAKEKSLECAEPPSLGALVVICQNELAAAQGQRERMVAVPLWQKLLAHVLDLSPPHRLA